MHAVMFYVMSLVTLGMALFLFVYGDRRRNEGMQVVAALALVAFGVEMIGVYHLALT